MPMLREKRDPIGSMGNDAALACLSDKPRLPYDYFKQLFAQVTNPPVDSIREEVIMSLECFIGPEGNLLEATEEQCHRLCIPHPILTNEEVASIKAIDHRGWKSKTIDITYPRSEGDAGLGPAIDRICAEATQAIHDGFSLVVLSDRAVSHERVPVSSLLVTGAVHHALVKQELRTRIGLVLESGKPAKFIILSTYGLRGRCNQSYLAFEAFVRPALTACSKKNSVMTKLFRPSGKRLPRVSKK